MAEQELEAIAAEHAIRAACEQLTRECVRRGAVPWVIITRRLHDDATCVHQMGGLDWRQTIGVLQVGAEHVWAQHATEADRRLLQEDTEDSPVDYLRRLMRELGIKDPTEEDG